MAPVKKIRYHFEMGSSGNSQDLQKSDSSKLVESVWDYAYFQPKVVRVVEKNLNNTDEQNLWFLIQRCKRDDIKNIVNKLINLFNYKQMEATKYLMNLILDSSGVSGQVIFTGATFDVFFLVKKGTSNIKGRLECSCLQENFSEFFKVLPVQWVLRNRHKIEIFEYILQILIRCAEDENNSLKYVATFAVLKLISGLINLTEFTVDTELKKKIINMLRAAIKKVFTLEMKGEPYVMKSLTTLELCIWLIKYPAMFSNQNILQHLRILVKSERNMEWLSPVLKSILDLLNVYDGPDIERIVEIIEPDILLILKSENEILICDALKIQNVIFQRLPNAKYKISKNRLTKFIYAVNSDIAKAAAQFLINTRFNNIEGLIHFFGDISKKQADLISKAFADFTVIQDWQSMLRILLNCENLIDKFIYVQKKTTIQIFVSSILQLKDATDKDRMTENVIGSLPVLLDAYKKDDFFLEKLLSIPKQFNLELYANKEENLKSLLKWIKTNVNTNITVVRESMDALEYLCEEGTLTRDTALETKEQIINTVMTEFIREVCKGKCDVYLVSKVLSDIICMANCNKWNIFETTYGDIVSKTFSEQILIQIMNIWTCDLRWHSLSKESNFKFMRNAVNLIRYLQLYMRFHPSQFVRKEAFENLFILRICLEESFFEMFNHIISDLKDNFKYFILDHVFTLKNVWQFNDISTKRMLLCAYAKLHFANVLDLEDITFVIDKYLQYDSNFDDIIAGIVIKNACDNVKKTSSFLIELLNSSFNTSFNDFLETKNTERFESKTSILKEQGIKFYEIVQKFFASQKAKTEFLKNAIKHYSNVNKTFVSKIILPIVTNFAKQNVDYYDELWPRESRPNFYCEHLDISSLLNENNSDDGPCNV